MSQDIIYHYCGIESFYSIASKKSFFLSSIYQMNDFLENTWIYRHIREVIDENRVPETSEFYALLESLQGYYATLHINIPARIPFIGCFSSCEDVLSQWRAYADNAMGVAIGFDRNEFTALLSKDKIGRRIRMQQVEYDQHAQYEAVRNTMMKYETTKSDTAKQVRENARRCAEELFELAASMKNGKFEEEMEWRLVYVPEIDVKNNALLIDGVPNRNDLQFTYGNKDIRARVTIEIPSVKVVYMGPRCKVDEVTLFGFLISNGHNNVEIDKSAASLR